MGMPLGFLQDQNSLSSKGEQYELLLASQPIWLYNLQFARFGHIGILPYAFLEFGFFHIWPLKIYSDLYIPLAFCDSV